MERLSPCPIRWKINKRIHKYKSLPDYVTVREARFRVEQRGFRSKSIVVVTTLLNPKQTAKEDLAFLYRARWNNELDLRSIKSTMQMDILRCKTPELVHKEVWTHILAYNLIRTIMAQAAFKHDIEPRTISFKATLQTLEMFQPLIDFQGHRGISFRETLYKQVLESVVLHRVVDRPDRIEPRKKKRREKRFHNLPKPRNEMKRDLMKGVRKTKRHSVRPPTRRR